jgi:hypothetical protein
MFYFPTSSSPSIGLQIGLLSELMLTTAKQYLSDPGDPLRRLTDPQPSRLSPWSAVRRQGLQSPEFDLSRAA